ncbi:MBL fold metallo-hydrolase [Candidatus Nitrospira inopinata]|jgi:glyoxylase-like metal-dependent hydrolase (beta-lactamase superfamily II)|uniref:Putative Hydrolase with N-terminal DNA-binding domain n=1 Tax=Candidatus Nitrospira inopinata TaxID=1715989 RepID=A0A0S4KT31_9BACT|nr:MBL fold metallo-hydrolase [Candidatus Nitrospira inopinata]CUQ66473.1 putative Hydrolase with N-terminal DNA-binding domain [Candidatus Nitrospira inopinata]
MPLEDDFCDILKKSRMGQGLSLDEVARATGLSKADLAAWERGDPVRKRSDVHVLADALGLRAEPLARIAIDHWEPLPRRWPAGVEAVRGSVGGYGVWGYVVFDEGEAVVIDTAYHAPAMVDLLGLRGLRLVGICLTHGHADHAEGIDQLLNHREVPVYLGREDRDLLGWRPRSDLLVAPADGQVIRVGRLTIACLVTPGHTLGGICYRLDDRDDPVCFVGDTLFAGSIGRSNPLTLYTTHLKSVRERVLTLAPNCRLLPGHGPATTVAEERAHNPFATVE